MPPRDAPSKGVCPPAVHRQTYPTGAIPLSIASHEVADGGRSLAHATAVRFPQAENASQEPGPADTSPFHLRLEPLEESLSRISHRLNPLSDPPRFVVRGPQPVGAVWSFVDTDFSRVSIETVPRKAKNAMRKRREKSSQMIIGVQLDKNFAMPFPPLVIKENLPLGPNRVTVSVSLTEPRVAHERKSGTDFPQRCTFAPRTHQPNHFDEIARLPGCPNENPLGTVQADRERAPSQPQSNHDVPPARRRLGRLVGSTSVIRDWGKIPDIHPLRPRHLSKFPGSSILVGVRR
mgnify:CR=1 FL=1